MIVFCNINKLFSANLARLVIFKSLICKLHMHIKHTSRLRATRLSGISIERCKKSDVEEHLRLRNSIAVNPFGGTSLGILLRSRVTGGVVLLFLRAGVQPTLDPYAEAFL